MFSIMSCNLRGVIFDDGPDRWELRQIPCLEILRRYAPDIFAFQECQQPQRDLFERELPGYHSVAMLDAIEGGGHPMNCLMVRNECFQECGVGTFALSETPHLPGSRSWNSHCPRHALYLMLKERATGNRILVINTHLDLDARARLRQAMLIDQFAAAYPPEQPVILTGDMNCYRDTPPLQLLLAHGWRDSYQESTGVMEPGTTFHGFQGHAFQRRPDEYAEHGDGHSKMDWILARGPLQCRSARIIDDTGSSGRFPSDHFFVRAEFAVSIPEM